MKRQLNNDRNTLGIRGYDEHINTPADYEFNPEKGQMNPNTKRFSYLGQQNDATLVSTWPTALFHTGHFHPNVTPGKIEARTHYLGTRRLFSSTFPKSFRSFRKKTPTSGFPPPLATTRSAVPFFCSGHRKVFQPASSNHVYEQHKFGIANLKVKGRDLVRISPTIYNSTRDVDDVVKATVYVILAMQETKLANNTHLRTYA